MISITQRSRNNLLRAAIPCHVCHVPFPISPTRPQPLRARIKDAARRRLEKSHTLSLCHILQVMAPSREEKKQVFEL